ncbi:MAG: Crp/Fnr family transcriptional regulator [Prolixibacteraceae bacterium]
MMKSNNTLAEDISLTGFRFFQSLSEDEMKSLNNEKVCLTHKKGTVLYKEGSRLTGFYCITRGIVKIYKTGNDGKEQIIRFAKKGDIIAYRSLLSQESACTSAKTIEEATLCHIPYKTLLSLIERNWKFSLAMLKIVCAELKEANDYITDIAQKTVRERLAEVLLLLKQEFSLDAENTLQISLTREELANMVGTATESIIRLLSEFKQDKLIDLQGRKIRIINLPALTKVANLAKY